MDPASVVPGSVMPKYPYMFTNLADIATAYANASTQKAVFGVPYYKEGMPKLGSWKEAKEQALADAKKIAADMKNQKVKDEVDAGRVPEIVALIAYLNALK
jgi:cytochrome c oxidase cbb3-type subunit 2